VFLHSLAGKGASWVGEQRPSKTFMHSESVMLNTQNEKFYLESPDYSDQATRLQSFKYWAGVLPKEELVEAGFYMTARRDVVRCFSCHVVLQDWEKTDNVIDEHRRHSPDCGFLKLVHKDRVDFHGTSEETTHTINHNSPSQLSTGRLGVSSNLRVEVEKDTFASNQTSIIPPDYTDHSEETRICEIFGYRLNRSNLWRVSTRYTVYNHNTFTCMVYI